MFDENDWQLERSKGVGSQADQPLFELKAV